MLACAVSLIFSAFCASAADEEFSYVVDDANVLTEETENYIEQNLKAVEDEFVGTVQFVTIAADVMPEYISDIGFLDEVGNLGTLFSSSIKNENIILWADGADQMKIFSLKNPYGKYENEKEVNNVISEHINGMNDKQSIIRDTFSINIASQYFNIDKTEQIPNTLTVGALDAEFFIDRELEKNSMYQYAGVAVFAGVMVVFAVIFIKNKTPEGTLPGDGSNFKEGFGSGVAACSNITGPQGTTTGLGSFSLGPKG